MPEKINEIILISENADGTPHIAPFGMRERGELLLIAPFRPSASLDNLISGRPATVNTTDDVRVFAGALTGRRQWPVNKLDGVWLLSSALSYRSLKLAKVEEDEQRPHLYFEVKKEGNLKPFRGYNRAQVAVIELCVLVSRLNRLPLEKILVEMEYLQIAIDKTAGEQELEAWGWLLEAVENHRAKITGANLA
jgi:uncharacterized protein